MVLSKCFRSLMGELRFFFFFAVSFNIGSHHKYFFLSSSTNEKLDRSNFIEGVRAFAKVLL